MWKSYRAEGGREERRGGSPVNVQHGCREETTLKRNRGKAPTDGPDGGNRLERRGFLRLALSLLGGTFAGLPLLGDRTALAIGRPTQVDIAYLLIPGAEPNPRPGVIETMLFELARNTSVEVKVEAVPLKPTDPRLFDHPLTMLLGTQAFPPLPDADVARLERYLRSGGILFIDDCSGLEISGFDASVRREIRRIFPRNDLERIGENHVIYRTFFLLRRIAGRVSLQNHLEGISLGEEVTPVLYSRNDLVGSFARQPGGGYLYDCIPGGDVQRVAAYKLGINLMMYALCLNYKHDLTHVRALLKKKRGVFDE